VRYVLFFFFKKELFNQFYLGFFGLNRLLFHSTGFFFFLYEGKRYNKYDGGQAKWQESFSC